MNYYNDNDAAIAQWLRNLIAAGLLPKGDVDDRSIAKVQPADLRGYIACHWFAGIGGWPLALQLAGWPPDRPVWTGSCPCQPYSSAGRRAGDNDPRNLWPQFRRLIAECQPPVVFGEQVDGADGLRWLAGVHADLEALGYAFGAIGLPAASVSAPHKRPRLWWVADSEQWSAERQRLDMAGTPGSPESEAQERERLRDDAGDGSASGGLGKSHGAGPQQGWEACEGMGHGNTPDAAGHWGDSILIPCADGKARRISPQPGDVPLAHGIPARMVKLRAYGNAIVVPLAAEFVRACMDTL